MYINVFNVLNFFYIIKKRRAYCLWLLIAFVLLDRKKMKLMNELNIFRVAKARYQSGQHEVMNNFIL